MAADGFSKKTVDDVPLSGQRVVVRVDFNVPIDGGRITDDTRIRESLPTIQKIIRDGASAVLMSHLGRPKGKIVDSMRLRPAADRLGQLLGRPVSALADCVGPEVERETGDMKPGQVALLENLRFHPEEEKNDAEFSKSLARLGTIYVNDAFGSAHRAHASTVGVTRFLNPRVAGYLMKKEIDYLGRILSSPERPFFAVFGGAKVSSKLSILRSLMARVDGLLIGGAMAYTFIAAQGGAIGKSLCEKECLSDARKILDEAARLKIDLLLPVDALTVTEVGQPSSLKSMPAGNIPADREGVDIGPETIRQFDQALRKARTIFWNGPVGIFEKSEYAEGTFALARSIAGLFAVKVVGGGDSVSAVQAAGVAGRMDHISTGGGASMEFLEGQELPGVAALDNK